MTLNHCGHVQFDPSCEYCAQFACSHGKTTAIYCAAHPCKHYHYGAGLHGCLYQDGPYMTDSYQDAVEGLAQSYELGRTRKATLKRDGYLELNLHRDGNEYCEITACSDDCGSADDYNNA